MAIAAIAIGNLSSPALYVASFHAEVFSDAGYTTMVGSQQSPAVQDPTTGNWVQSSLMSFTGLVRGQTYYIQAGPVSPTGGVANFNRFSIQAGTLTIPACTYSGTFASTTSGVTYDITPASVPADIDHFEAIWSKDGSAPSNSSLTNAWTGSPLANGIIHLFVGGSPGQTIHLFMRGVSKTGGYQNWVAVDNRTVSAVATGGSTSAAGITYADGTTVEALKPGQAGADKTSSNTAADTSAVNGINSGHVADTATSVGFLGKWWRTSSGAPAPTSGGELPYAPMFVTHDANLNYNIHGYTWAGAIMPPSFAPFGPTGDGQWIYARFTGYYTASATGTYTFGTNSDDGSNLYVNNTAIVSELAATHGAGADRTYLHSGTINLTAGDTYEVVVEYRNGVNNCGLQVLFTPPGGSIQLLDLGTAYKSAAYTHYTDGTPVDALKPAAAGADVTAVNVSADTSSVNGRASADVANTVLAGGGIDYLHTSNANIPQNANSLLIRGSFEDGKTGTWGTTTGLITVTGQGFTKGMELWARDNFEYGNSFAVVPGQRIYIYGSVNTASCPNAATLGLQVTNAAGGVTWVGAASLSPGSGWTTVSGFLTIPAGYTSAMPWIQINTSAASTSQPIFVANLFYSKTAAVDFAEPTHVNKNAANIPYSSGATIESLKPAQAGADVTAQQPIAYAGANESIVPNGNFVLGTDTGWVAAQSGASHSWIMEQSPDAPRIHFPTGTTDGACSPSFSVTPGRKYKVTYRIYAGTGTQSTYLRLASQALYAPNITADGGSFDGSTSRHMANGFMEAGIIGANLWTNISYDWTCPAGDNYASVMVYHWGGTCDSYCQGISVIPYATNTERVGSLTVTGGIAGANGTAIDSSGNIILKNIGTATGTGTALTGTFATLPSMNPSYTLKGNPVLVALSAAFQSTSSGGTVTSTGFSPTGATSNSSGSAPPNVTITISGDGSGATASVSWSGSGGPVVSYTPTVILNPGSGYSFAHATVTVSVPSGTTYSGPGSGTYTCAVSTPTPRAGVSLSAQVLMDGAVLFDPVQIITDANGRAKLNEIQVFSLAAGTHTFAVQAKYDAATPANFINGLLNVVELG